MNAPTVNPVVEEVLDFDIELIIASRTNPRTTFLPAYITELAGTIKQMGRVQQAILLRPLPASRLEETAHMKPRPTHEIVFGECRWRGSKEAGMRTIKSTVRDLSDKDTLIIQLIENLERTDLNALEEGQGFKRLMEETGQTADEVGARFKRSRNYVYGRIKLLELGQDASKALIDRKIEPSIALLVARIPDAKLQAKALQEILKGDYHSDGLPLSHRRAQELMQRDYMLKLSTATFDIKSVDLVMAAGACTTCPKRTGHAPELFQDVPSADVCTDPACFHKKGDAHAANQVAAAEAKGLTVIAGKEAQELQGNGYGSEKFVGYRRLDNAEDSPTEQPLRKLIGALMKSEGIKPVMIAHPRKKGEFVECLTNEIASKLLKMAQKQVTEADPKAPAVAKASKEVQQLVADKKEKQEAKRKAEFEQDWRDLLVADTWVTMRDDATIKGFGTNVHRYLAVRAANGLSQDEATAICKILNLGKVSPISGVIMHARETPNPEMLHLLIIMQKASSAKEYSYAGRVANEGLLLVAGNVFGDQLDQVIKEIKVEVKDKIWPKAQKALPATAPLAQPIKVADKGKPVSAKDKKTKPAAQPKLSEAEAKSGIAAAMQGLERPATTPAEATKGKTQAGTPSPVGVLTPVQAWPFPIDGKPSNKGKAAPKPGQEEVFAKIGDTIKLRSVGLIEAVHGAIGEIAKIQDGVFWAKVKGQPANVGLFCDQFDVIDKAGIAAAPKPASAPKVLAVGTAVRVVADKKLLGPLMARFASRDGTVAKDLGDGYLTIKLKKGGSNMLARDQIEVVA